MTFFSTRIHYELLYHVFLGGQISRLPLPPRPWCSNTTVLSLKQVFTQSHKWRSMYKEGRDCAKHDSWYIKQGLLIPDPTLLRSKSRATLSMLLQSRAYPHPSTWKCNMKHTGLQSLWYNRGTGAQHCAEVFALALGSMLLQRHKQWVYRGEKEDKGAADLHLCCAESDGPILITGDQQCQPAAPLITSIASSNSGTNLRQP